ncbi:MAG: hypothetical protein PHW18_05435 [Sulfuricurvum sp.]|uniref:hypothetical protein n=1 Tax=Sulfuricurvum sp. TaxID=2025608 RepID=UPI002620867D|nr:hypothetical protein [Sulfuricurvum sp.]MDD2828999.1 hypothetical protein [Sulfuricurvum sp.]MDD4949626.1 hypothetical protein [Sulfuricurvum sp.]
MRELEKLEAEICNLVELSLSDKTYCDQVSFLLSEKTIDKAWKHFFIDIRDYTCVIHSDEIRHIKNEHHDDVYLICKIPYYLEKFVKLERNIVSDKKTGKPVISLIFIKRNENNSVKMVKTNLSREKILRLKTLFEVV